MIKITNQGDIMRKGILLLACLALVSCKHARNATVTAQDGAQGLPGISGKNGVDGLNGKNGAKGATGPKGSTGAQGPKGDRGNTGVSGSSSVSMNVYHIPTKGKCVNIRKDIYIENEGNHIDIYNNPNCDHKDNGQLAYCDNVADGEDSGKNEVCNVSVDGNVFEYTVKYDFEDTLVFEKVFLGVPSTITLQ